MDIKKSLEKILKHHDIGTICTYLVRMGNYKDLVLGMSNACYVYGAGFENQEPKEAKRWKKLAKVFHDELPEESKV